MIRVERTGKQCLILQIAVLLMAALAPLCSQALIDPGYLNGSGESSELFISIVDEIGKQSYYKDLGITMEALKAREGCIDANLEKDPKFQAFLKNYNDVSSKEVDEDGNPKAPLAFTIAGVYPFKDDGSNRSSWGFVATSDSGESIFDTATTNVMADLKLLQAYIAKLNSTVISTLVTENFSQVIPVDSNAYHGDPDNIAGFRSGQTDVGLDAAAAFYFVQGGKPKGKTELLGNWTLTSAGVLGYVPMNGSAYKICDPSDTGGGPPPDEEEPPPDEEEPPPDTEEPPPDDEAPPANDVTNDVVDSPQKRILNPKVSGLLINVPSTGLLIGKKNLILIRSNLIEGRRRIQLSYSLGNGQKWRKLGTTKVRSGKFMWRPRKKDVAESAMLKACVKASSVCDQITVKVVE
ncbi:MAG: hypothetical protein ACKN9W_08765 [Methylococcus sp.]